MGGQSWEAHWRSLLATENEAVVREVVQGRAYHRSGRVTDLRMSAGFVAGRVQGRQSTARVVEVTVATLTAREWATVVDLLAGQLRHSARLLAGLQPEGLAEELADLGVQLLPEPDDVATTCGCGAVRPCAHVAATWEATSDQIADDPFTLLHLRGRGRERLLADLAANRAQQADHAVSVPLTDLSPAGWARNRAPLEDLHLPSGQVPDRSGAPLRLLGDPPGWPRGPGADELFGPLVERAARWAAGLDDDERL